MLLNLLIIRFFIVNIKSILHLFLLLIKFSILVLILKIILLIYIIYYY